MLFRKVGDFTAKTGSTGSQSTTGIGFKPKAVLTFNSRATAAGSVAGAGVNFGFTDTAANDISGGYNSADNVATTDIVRTLRNNRWYGTLPYGSSSGDSNATVTTLDNDGWTLNYNAVAAGYKIPYLAIGGDEITNTFAGTFALNTSTGNQAITGVGFKPDIVFLIFQSLGTTSGDSNNDCCFGFGVAKSSSARWCTELSGDNGVVVSDTRRSFHNDHCIVISNINADTVNGSADFVSMDSDGFTINIDDAPAAAYLVGFLAIKGGSWAVGTDTQKTSSGTQAKTGIGFQPSALILASAGYETANAITPTARFSFGVSDGVSTESIWFGDEDGTVVVTKCDSRYATDKILMFYDEAGAGAPTLLAEASVSSFDSDGYTLNWSTADATARIFGYVAFTGNANKIVSILQAVNRSHTY